MPALSAGARLREIRGGFESSFWVANFTEIFERLAYYGMMAVLAIYLTEQLHFSTELAASLVGIVTAVVYFLPILGGALADRFGFRNALLFAFLVMTLGYFLLGSLSATWMQPARAALGDKWLVLAILLVPALGPSVVKPCVAGTTARASKESVRSLGYSIYYTMVNIGGAIGPLTAFFVRKQLGLGIQNVFRVSAASVFLMFWVILLLYREPAGGAKGLGVMASLKNMFVVLGNLRFLLFLLISSGFYVVFWQLYVSMPIFMRRYVDPQADVDKILTVEGVAVICLQIAIAYLTRKMKTVPTIALGFLVSGLAWILLAERPSVTTLAVMLVIVALGEVTQASRYYEYCSRLAPAGQQGVYMGYAFLPIAIGSLIAGPLGGYLLHQFGDVMGRPNSMWWVIVGIGSATAALMLLYDRLVRPVATDAEG